MPDNLINNEIFNIFQSYHLHIESIYENITDKDKKIIKIVDEDNEDELQKFLSNNNLDCKYEIRKYGGIFNYIKIPIVLYCIQKKSLKCFKSLIMQGADPNSKCIIKQKDRGTEIEYGWNGPQFAIAVEADSIFNQITENISNKEELIFPLIRFQRNEQIFDNYKDFFKVTKDFIQEAAEYNNIRILSQLCKSLNSIDVNDAFLRSCKNGHLEAVRELLKKGANVNTKDNERLIYGLGFCNYILRPCQSTALIHSSYYGYIEIVQELLKMDADINIRDEHIKKNE